MTLTRQRPRRSLRSRSHARGGMRIATALVLAWLLVGALAAGQRHYYSSSRTNCAGAGTVVVTMIAGPLNYAGVNPKISHCDVPRPSK